MGPAFLQGRACAPGIWRVHASAWSTEGSRASSTLSGWTHEGLLVIRYALRLRGHEPPVRRGHGRECEKEAIDDPAHGKRGDELHATPAEELVDGVGEDEHHRPQQGAGGEAQRTGLAKQVPFQGRNAQGSFKGEDLDADEFGPYRVDAEERGQAMNSLAARSSSVRAADMAQRSPARVKGTLSGATAPPEMMKLIAWSTVQSVGVSSSIGTISR